jgi:threonine dehydrogenase-like Zn-dependent dehydrogenase
MKAVVNYAPEPCSVELREIAEPVPRAGEVLLRVRAVGVCGSDLHQYHGTHSWKVNYPVVLGHEFAGSIEALGEGVEGWQVGDCVVCETAAVICGQCAYCRTGRYNLCPQRLGFGYGIHGAMARYVRVPVRVLHRLPDELTFEEGAFTEPCCSSARRYRTLAPPTGRPDSGLRQRTNRAALPADSQALLTPHGDSGGIKQRWRAAAHRRIGGRRPDSARR